VHIGDGVDEDVAIQELVRRNQELEIEVMRLQSASVSPHLAPSHVNIALETGNLSVPMLGEQAYGDLSSANLGSSVSGFDSGHSAIPVLGVLDADNVGGHAELGQNPVASMLPHQFSKTCISNSSTSQAADENCGWPEPQYSMQLSPGTLGASASVGRRQEDSIPFVTQSEASLKTYEFENNFQVPIRSLGWPQWQINKP
jgi:hypothetical protein